MQYVQHKRSTHTRDRSQALRALRSELQRIGGRRHRHVGAEELTYEDIRDAWVADAIATGKRSVRRGTIKTGPLDRFFGGWRVSDFSVADLKRYRAEGLAQGKSQSTLNRHMAALRRMFKLAVQNELLTLAEIPAYFPQMKESRKAVNPVYIDKQQYKKLCGALPEPLRSAFVVCYWTAMRVHEMMRLRWKDVDGRVIHLGITKTGEPRDVFLPSDFKLCAGKPDDLVFPLDPELYLDHWKKVCVRVGVGQWVCSACGASCKGQVCPEHGKRRLKALRYVGPLLKHTRHTAVRNMADTGADESRIMAISGHVTRSTFDRYNIGKQGDLDLMRQRLEGLNKTQSGVNRSKRK